MDESLWPARNVAEYAYCPEWHCRVVAARRQTYDGAWRFYKICLARVGIDLFCLPWYKN